MLYGDSWPVLGDVIPADAIVGVTPQVLLASSLSGHAELQGDLRPSHALTDCGVDKDRQLSFSCVPLYPDVLDLLQQLGRRRRGGWLRHAGLMHGLLLASSRSYASGSRRRLPLRSAHATSMRATTDMLGATDIHQHPNMCDLGHIPASAEATWRTVTVFCGRLRTHAVGAKRAGGSCAAPVPVAQWTAGGEACRRRRVEGPGAPARSHRSLSVREQSAPHGALPRLPTRVPGRAVCRPVLAAADSRGASGGATKSLRERMNSGAGHAPPIP